MQLVLDDDEVEVLQALIDLNIRAIKTAIAGDIRHVERALHGVRLIHLQRIQNKLRRSMN